jgi:D-3-phosphoglycerate dehydrogenase
LSGTVLIDPPLFSADVVHDLLSGLDVTIDERRRHSAFSDVIGLLVWEPVTPSDIVRLANLRAIVTASVGVDHVDLEAARRRGIWVCHVPDYCVEEMADTALAMLLSLARGVVVLDRSVRDGRWDDHAAGPLSRLSDVRLGIVGFGRIGRAVSRRALALGIDTWAADPVVLDKEIAATGATPARLDELLRRCNAVTLHLPLTAQSRRLIGARELALMPPGSFLINTARGQLVDLDAVLHALDSGRLAGAALDVLEVEPPTEGHPAPRHPRLTVTPHAGWYSPQAEHEVVRRSTLALRAILEGGQPEGVILRGDANRPEKLVLD